MQIMLPTILLFRLRLGREKTSLLPFSSGYFIRFLFLNRSELDLDIIANSPSNTSQTETISFCIRELEQKFNSAKSFQMTIPIMEVQSAEAPENLQGPFFQHPSSRFQGNHRPELYLLTRRLCTTITSIVYRKIRVST